MKLNNKGFAISTILYGLLSLLIMVLMMTFQAMRSNNINKNDYVINISSYLNDGTGTGTCREARINYNNCYDDPVGTCSALQTIFENEC